ncbi:MAG: hypothetical protein OIN83_08320 [Candidatus Methanoperedens sp.]|nr:hypothetical protein [Candidatus Methanoperedens sp.]
MTEINDAENLDAEIPKELYDADLDDVIDSHASMLGAKDSAREFMPKKVKKSKPRDIPLFKTDLKYSNRTKLFKKYGAEHMIKKGLTLKEMFQFDTDAVRVEGDKLIWLKEPEPEAIPNPIPIPSTNTNTDTKTDKLSLLDIPETTPKTIEKIYQESRPIQKGIPERRLIHGVWKNLYRV